jgi:hypothetical protein
MHAAPHNVAPRNDERRTGRNCHRAARVPVLSCHTADAGWPLVSSIVPLRIIEVRGVPDNALRPHCHGNSPQCKYAISARAQKEIALWAWKIAERCE